MAIIGGHRHRDAEDGLGPDEFGERQLRPERAYSTGAHTVALAVADLNGDRAPDVATANSRASTVSLHLNRGNGTFRRRIAYGVGPAPQSVAVGDLNGDGLPDLATVNTSRSPQKKKRWFNGFSVLRNVGGGRFRLAVKRDVPGYITAALWSVAIGDLNMDGRADLVAGNADDRLRAVSVFVNRGHGRFESKLDFGSDTAASWGMHAVGVADLNRDRKPDIALVVGYRTLAVLLNRPGLCSVQPVQEQLLSLARRTLARVNCGVNVRVGHSRFFSKYYPTQTRVIRQRPRAGSVLSAGSKVNLLVSLGRKRHTRR